MITKEHVGKRLLFRTSSENASIPTYEEAIVMEISPSGAFARIAWRNINETWVDVGQCNVIEELSQKYSPTIDPLLQPDSGEIKSW